MQKRTFSQKTAEGALILWLSIIAILFLGKMSTVHAASPEGDFTFDAVTGCITEYKGSEQNVEVPEQISGVSVTGIEWGAFSNKNVTQVVLPNTVRTIGAMAFEGCSGLTSVTIPEGVSVIAPYTFYGCSSLQSVTLPASAETIMLDAFAGCTALTEITIPERVNGIEEEAFASHNGELTIVGNENSFAKNYADRENIKFRAIREENANPSDGQSSETGDGQKDNADQIAANQVITLIDQIGEVSLASEKQINDALDAYGRLTENQKTFVTNYSDLQKAKTVYEQLKADDQAKAKAAQDQAAAKAVIDRIDGIGSITLDSEESLNAIRKDYNSLTDDQKKLVTNLNKLVDAEAKLDELKKNEDTTNQGGQPSGSGQENGTGNSGNNQGTGTGNSGNNQGTGTGNSGDNQGTGTGNSGNNQGTGTGNSGNNQGTDTGNSGYNQGTGTGNSGNNQETDTGNSGNNQGTDAGNSENNQGNGTGTSGDSQGTMISDNASLQFRLSKSKATLYTKGKKTLTLNAYDNGTLLTANSVTWTSSNSKVAAVSSTGKITAKKKGKAIISATYKGVTVKATITVKKPILKLKKSKATLAVNKKVTIKAKATPAKKITYKSGNKKVATVSKKGVVTAQGKGKTTITVKANGVKKKFTVTVK